MSSISGHGYSRGNYAQILRARNSSSSGNARNEKGERSEKGEKGERGEKGRRSRGDSDEAKVKGEKGEATKESSGTRSLGENVVVNGSFEKHSLGKNTWGLNKEIEGFKSTNGREIELQTGVAGKASDGQTLVELDSTGNGGIYQDVKTEKGEKYQLSVDFSARPGVATESNTVEVYFNGKKIDTLNADGRGKSDTSFETKTYEVEATGDESRLEFRAAGKSDSLGGYIDNVKLQKITTSKTEGGSDNASSKKVEELGDKFDSLRAEVGAKVSEVAKKVDDLGNRLDVRDGEIEKQFQQVDEKIDDLGTKTSDRLDATDKKIDDLGGQVNDRLDQTDQKIDELGDSVDDRFNNVDDKLNDINDKLGEQVTNVSVDLSTAVTELKEVIKEVGANNDSKLTDTVKDLKKDFNKQFDDLKSQHEAQTNALLEKLDEVTTALKTLSEQSSEQISVLKDKLGGLGGQLGTVINKIDLLGQGQVMSHRSIGLFNAAAKVGDGALDKLIGLVGPGNTGNQLRSAQSRLQSVSARFGGGQAAGGVNLLA